MLGLYVSTLDAVVNSAVLFILFYVKRSVWILVVTALSYLYTVINFHLLRFKGDLSCPFLQDLI